MHWREKKLLLCNHEEKLESGGPCFPSRRELVPGTFLRAEAGWALPSLPSLGIS
jgi:hypothetical protein